MTANWRQPMLDCLAYMIPALAQARARTAFGPAHGDSTRVSDALVAALALRAGLGALDAAPALARFAAIDQAYTAIVQDHDLGARLGAAARALRPSPLLAHIDRRIAQRKVDTR